MEGCCLPTRSQAWLQPLSPSLHSWESQANLGNAPFASQRPFRLPIFISTEAAPPHASAQVKRPTCGRQTGPGHCCLQVESFRILLLVEEALRDGLDEALARRSALVLPLSCPGSVPFMHTGLGNPRLRLCPFCLASSSGT